MFNRNSLKLSTTNPFKHSSKDSPDETLSKSYDYEHNLDLFKKNSKVVKVPTVLSLKNTMLCNSIKQKDSSPKLLAKELIKPHIISTDINKKQNSSRFFIEKPVKKLSNPQGKPLSFEIKKDNRARLLTEPAPKSALCPNLKEKKISFNKDSIKISNFHQRTPSVIEKGFVIQREIENKPEKNKNNSTFEDFDIKNEENTNKNPDKLENTIKYKENRKITSLRETILEKTTFSCNKNISQSYNFMTPRINSCFIYPTTESESSNLSLRYSCKTHKGFFLNNSTKPNQDSFIAYPNFCRNIHQYLFSICDGHGPEGHLVSQFIKEQLPKILQNDKELPLNPYKSLYNSIQETQNQLISSTIDIQYSGSTTLVLFIKEQRLFIVNVGDSRAVAGKQGSLKEWQGVLLSNDHKPENLHEKERILKAGGRIERLKDSKGNEIGPNRVWLTKENSYGISMSRSIGDSLAKNYGVTWEPEIKEFKLDDEIKFIIVASDGLWDIIQNDECVNFIGSFYENNDLEEAVKTLLQEAEKRWMRYDSKAIDDITFIIIFIYHF